MDNPRNPLKMQKQNQFQNKKFPHVLAAVYGTPWAITESWLETIAGIVEDRSKASIEEFKAMMDDADGDESPLQMVGNVAVIPVMGPIVPRANFFSAMSGATSSSGVSDMIDEAMDKRPDAIVFQIDSPGGAIPGGFEVANKIAALPVPTIAMIEGTGASLAYLWAAQCDMVYCSQASVVGSVSVIMRMVSGDRAMKNDGMDITTMKSGALKNAGDPSGLQSSAQYQSLLTQLNTYHDMFTAAVSTKRAQKMDVSKIASGDVWIGAQAVVNGLADGISTMQGVIDMLNE